MQTVHRHLPLDKLDRYWSTALGFEAPNLRAGSPRFVPSGQRQIQVLATPDGAVVVGHPHFINRARQVSVAELLTPEYWATQFQLSLTQLPHFGPSSLSYVTAQLFRPQPHEAVRLLRRTDAAELARFARILHAREPQIFHSWAIGGRVTANERVWGALLDHKIIAVAGLRQVQKQFYEVGINTLPTYRQQGWGTAVASTATEEGLILAPLVQWSAPLNNTPSTRIAARLGYRPYAHQLWLSVPDGVSLG